MTKQRGINGHVNLAKTRRQSLQLIAGSALLPALAGGWPLAARAAAASFNPPTTAMNLTRKIVRELADGAMISVARQWLVRFVHDTSKPSGFTVTGRQISVDVIAPTALEFLAKIERQKIEDGLFPMKLGPEGLILSDQNEPDPVLIDRAATLALARINATQLGSHDGKDARQFLTTLQQSAAQLISKLPRDLFRPRQTNWQHERDITLPGGQIGKVSVLFSAQMDAAGGIMQHAQRSIITSIGNASRTSDETWTLIPA